MGSSETLFFAIEDDLFPILDAVERECEIEYVVMGRFEFKTSQTYASFTRIPQLGFTDYGDWAGPDHRYLIKPKDSTLNIEEFELSKGGVVFLIDQKLNPDTIVFAPKGVYTKKNKVIVAGRVSTISDTESSLAIYKPLSSKIKKNFRRIGVFYVGPKAEEKLKEGWRLVQIANSPREYDLAYET
ncbi:MAG: hypothetical protein AB7F88_12625 [Pyrinomonadaceae bacterium]